MDTSSRAGRVVSVSSLYWRSALESRRNSPRELGHGSPAGAQLLARHWEMQGADTALPAGDRDLINSVISRPDYLKGTGSGASRASCAETCGAGNPAGNPAWQSGLHPALSRIPRINAVVAA